MELQAQQVFTQWEVSQHFECQRFCIEMQVQLVFTQCDFGQCAVCQCTGIELQTQLVFTQGDAASALSVRSQSLSRAQLVFTQSNFSQRSESRTTARSYSGQYFGVCIETASGLL